MQGVISEAAARANREEIRRQSVRKSVKGAAGYRWWVNSREGTYNGIYFRSMRADQLLGRWYDSREILATYQGGP